MTKTVVLFVLQGEGERVKVGPSQLGLSSTMSETKTIVMFVLQSEGERVKVGSSQLGLSSAMSDGSVQPDPGWGQPRLGFHGGSAGQTDVGSAEPSGLAAAAHLCATDAGQEGLSGLVYG
jgi:hypothetical protein